MITKINKIKDFGVFKNFSGTTVPEFKTFNLIYGWNYSGKTTLSRVFRCLEKKTLHPDYEQATFNFQADPLTVYDQDFTTNVNVRVFNSDFIKENLKWDVDNFEPIFLLGAENIQLQTELEAETQKYDAEKIAIDSAKRSSQEKINNLNTALTNKAREITQLLGLGRNFDRDKLKVIVDAIKGKADQFRLDDAEFEKYKTQALSTEQKPTITELEVKIPSIQTAITNTNLILSRQLLTSNKIQKLLDDKDLSYWVETGKSLHKGKTDCEFCGNKLPDGLLTRLNEHFSNDYETLKADIDAQIITIKNYSINPTIPAETAFYKDLTADFNHIKLSLETEIKTFLEALSQLEQSLSSKKERPFDQISTSVIKDNTKQLSEAIKALNELIKKNNKRTQDFQAEKEAAVQKIKEDYAAKFEQSECYSQVISDSEEEQKEITIRETANVALNQKLLAIKAQLDETVKGAEKVNEALRVFFGKDDVQITSTPDKKFQLKRGNEIAKNLSEGERTAISFAYFVAKLEEQNNKIIDTVIYIDDPVSSLDANHLFNIYSFIKTTFYEFAFDDTRGKKVHKPKCKQLFISTHSFDFHNLVFDWFKALSKDTSEFFMVERHKNSLKDESIIKKNTNLITQFNSEYAYLYSLIDAFIKAPTENWEQLYHLPNIMRRFVETYLNFKYMSPYKIDEHIDQLIGDPVTCERTRKFLHYHSHSLNTEKFVKFADLSECIYVAQAVIDAIRANDPIHYLSLQDAISKT